MATVTKERKTTKGQPRAPRVSWERPQDNLARQLKRKGLTHDYIASVTGIKRSRVETVARHMRRKGELVTLADRQGRTEWTRRLLTRYDDLIKECQQARRMAGGR